MMSDLFEFREIDFEIVGLTQMSMHRPTRVNPREPLTKAINALTSKRKKTEEDNIQIAELEWQAALYSRNGVIGVPGDMIEGALVEAGKKSNQGKNVRAGLWSPGFWPLVFPGNDRTIEEIMQDPKHFWTCRVGINGKSSIMRTRPCFPEWSLKFKICYKTEIFSEHVVINMMRVLGTIVGLSDCRAKRGGRFDVVSPPPYNPPMNGNREMTP